MWFLRRRKTDNIKKADAALKDAKNNLRRVKSRTPEVRSIVGDLRELREENHFGEQLEAIFIQAKRQPG